MIGVDRLDFTLDKKLLHQQRLERKSAHVSLENSSLCSQYPERSSSSSWSDICVAFVLFFSMEDEFNPLSEKTPVGPVASSVRALIARITGQKNFFQTFM